MNTSCDACGQEFGSDRTLFEALRDLGVAFEKIARLEAECADNYSSAADRIAELMAECAALKVDAERYRWLRDPACAVGLVMDKVVGTQPYDEGTQTGGYHLYEYRAGDELDSAIDAAMQAGEKP